jgi:hypothetical protein
LNGILQAKIALMRQLFLPLSALFLLSLPAVLVQTSAPVQGREPVVAPPPGKAPEDPRLQKLRQLTFDRRPSAILQAWAPAAPAEKAKAPADATDVELAALQRDVTLGNWAAVKDYLAKLPEADGKTAYLHLLQAIQRMPMAQPRPDMGGMSPMAMQWMEKNVFSVDDVIGLAAAAPRGLEKDKEKEALGSLGGILRQALEGDTVVENAVARLQVETGKPNDRSALTNRQAAQVLLWAGQAAEAGAFLPTLEKAQADHDAESLNLLARHFLGLHGKDAKTVHLQRAWEATQAALAAKDAPPREKEDALRRAVELAPRVQERAGLVWLEESFTRQPERGMAVLAAIGSLASQGLQTHPMNADFRLKSLKLQKTAVEALLKAAPQRAEEWRSTLRLLGGNWLREAEFSYQYGRSTSLGPRMYRDPFGNIYYINDDDFGPRYMPQERNMPQAIVVGEVLENRPGEAWVSLLDDGQQAKLSIVFAQLYLKVGEEAKAFPYIEGLATTHREKARDLSKEFLRIWTQNHDPNAARRYTNPYMYMFGFERRSESIPLTRSKQERNLSELSGWVAKLRKLPIGDLDEELLAKAFTTCHSSAEVYKLEAIEKVFGSLAGLKPKTLAELVQQMRENLAGLWRKPEVQKDKQTNRKTKDIEAEVLRGYSVAQAVIDDGLTKFPGDWSLHLAKAALWHDENSYHQEVAKSSEFAERRNAAMAQFKKAAQLYAAKAKDLSQDDETARVYEQWFYASLGACDLPNISEENHPDLKQPPLIREALRALPGEAAERHMAKFANALFTRMSAVKPAVKYRYLKGGFEIVGDHKQAYEARKVYDYYKDLVTEIKLEAAIDGSDKVGHGQPFGVFVNLRHTREIERESGGFGRYLQNQNASMFFAYNYGRPLADYRDKFQAAAHEALKEHFEVISVTFQTEKVNSRALSEYGWRYTPYAYLLLKARGPQVDKIPPLRLDLDFLDTSGYVIIPIESPAVPLDAAPAKGEPRPFRKLQVTQTLDERQSAQGKLVLEVKATAQGLVPDLDQMLDLTPEGFEIVKTDDQGISVSKFDPESPENVVVSERTSLVSLQALPGQQPRNFRFGATKVEGAEIAYQRYSDADLVSAPAEVALEASYGRRSRAWLWLTPAVLLAAVALAVGGLLWLRRRVPLEESTWQLPATLTPFTVLGLLRRMEQNDGLNDAQKSELRSSIATVERHFFSEDGNGEVDLKTLAESWVSQAPGASQRRASAS